jgi:hypothetical protein
MHVEMLHLQQQEAGEQEDIDDLREVCRGNLESFITMDEDLATFETIGDDWENDLLGQAKKWCGDDDAVSARTSVKDSDSDEDNDDDNDDDDDASVSRRMKSYRQAIQVTDDLFKFSLMKQDDELQDAVLELQHLVQKKQQESKSVRQLKLTYFFSSDTVDGTENH